MKRGGGSADFLADLDLLSLTPGVVYAVKNNSRDAFFEIRDSTFEVVVQKMQKFFRDNIKNITASLDKDSQPCLVHSPDNLLLLGWNITLCS